MQKFQYVHFATHALVDEDHAAQSSIVLSLIDRRGRRQNGFLRLEDIYGLQLEAELVVLSACATATGRYVGGEGLMSLARGVLYAGARRVMVSLWDVDDAATAALMAEFYAGLLGDRLPPAAALQRAQAVIRRDARFAHPFYWAGWVIQGRS
jgi:CHAT domain-containing protein